MRGVALDGKRIYRGFRDGYMIAYDAQNGEQIWSAEMHESDGKPATIAASPLVWNGMVFIGTSGAERACGCVIAGLDAATGKVVWTFALVPTGDAPGAESWPKGVHVGGGSVWTSLTIDPDSGALYVPTGNPGPDFSGAYRPGANLYTGSIVVLDAKKGSLRTWYQLVPHDVHDWDQAAAPALIVTKAGERRAMAAGKDGFLHSIDITAGKVAWKTPVTTIREHGCTRDSGGHTLLPRHRGRRAMERSSVFTGHEPGLREQRGLVLHTEAGLEASRIRGRQAIPGLGQCVRR